MLLCAVTALAALAALAASVATVATVAALAAFPVVALLHFILQLGPVPFVSLVRWQVTEKTFAGDACLHWLITANDWAGVGIARLLVGDVAVNSEVHSDVINPLESIGRLASGHVLEYKVVKLMLEDTQLVIIGERPEELRGVHQLELG